MNKNLQPHLAAKKVAIAVGLALATAGAQAQTYLYEFGYQLTNPSSTLYQPADTFALMSVTTYDNIHYSFDLRMLPSFGALFGNPNAYIGGVSFNTSLTSPAVSSVGLAGGSWGVSNVSYRPFPFNVGGILFDFTEGLGGTGNHAQNYLTSGERVVWQTTFGQQTAFSAPPFAVKVWGIGADDSAFAFYAPTSVSPVPEPETYAMLLAGLGMLGFAARRRQKKEAAAA